MAAVAAASLGLAAQVLQFAYEIYKNHRAASRQYTEVMGELAAMRPYLALRETATTPSKMAGIPPLRESIRLAKTSHKRGAPKPPNQTRATALYLLFEDAAATTQSGSELDDVPTTRPRKYAAQ